MQFCVLLIVWTIGHHTEPVIAGDVKLLELAEKARAANAQLLAVQGELVAQLRLYYDKRAWPFYDATIRCAWQGEKYLSDLVVQTPIAGRPPHSIPFDDAEAARVRKSGEQPPAQNLRVLFDGRKYFVYHPIGITPAGHLQILGSLKDVQNILFADLGDQRPHVKWYCHPRGSPWSQWLQIAGDKRNPLVVRWEIQRQREQLTVRRLLHMEQQGKTYDGANDFVMDLTLAGAVVHFKGGDLVGGGFGAGKDRSSATFKWRANDNGVAVLHGYRFDDEFDGRSSRLEYRLLEFSPDRALQRFDEKALNVRAGARVDDKISAKTYTYGGRRVDQGDLKALIEKAKAKLKASRG